MELWIIWLIAAGVLILLELFTQMVWTLCMGIGCLVAALCAGLDIDLVWQIVFAGGSAVLAYILLMPLAKRWQKRQRAARIRAPAWMHCSDAMAR